MIPAVQEIMQHPAAIYVNTGNMAPTIPFGSVVFVAAPAFQGEGVYSFPCMVDARLHDHDLCDLRRVSSIGDGSYAVLCDGLVAPLGEMTIARLHEIAPRRVVGITTAQTVSFGKFLKQQFGEQL